MLNKLVVSFLAYLLFIGFALADDEWVEIADTKAAQWLGKKGSGSVSNLGAKQRNAYGYVYQVSDKMAKTYKYFQVFVELDSCKKGYGNLYDNDMQGQYTGKDMFVRFGDTVADALGTMACTSWDHETGKVSRANSGNVWEVVAVAEATGNKFSIKTDTLRKTKYEDKPAISTLYSYYDIKKRTTEYGEFIIKLSDCKKGYGVVYELNFDGKFVQKYDIALNGDSVMSLTPSSICAKL